MGFLCGKGRMVPMFSEEEESFVLYINGKIDSVAKDQLITQLQDEGYLLTASLFTKRDLNQWVRSSTDNVLLFVTDAQLGSKEVKEVIGKLQNSKIFCLHDEAVEANHADTGNQVKAFTTLDDLLNYFYFLAEQGSDAMIDRDAEELAQQQFEEHLKNLNSQQKTESSPVQFDKESSNMYIPDDTEEELPMGGYGSTEYFEEELHPALMKVTEFQNSPVTNENELPILPNPDNVTELVQENDLPHQDVPVQPPNVPVQENEVQGVKYTESPLHNRSRSLQKQLFFQKKWEGNRVIGVWSPLHRSGVTSLTMNFAFYLAQRRIFTVVLEGLTSQHAMKDWLKRYTAPPENWTSYANALQSDSSKAVVQWLYKNVNFLPLEKGDSQLDWTAKTLELYMTTPNIVDVTLVDMPTGEMEVYTRDSLHYLDELWVVVDDAIQETLAWKSYIHELRDTVDIPIHLVFNKQYDFSQDKRLAKELDLPLLTSIPALHSETMQNYYENKPLYFQEGIVEKIEPSYQLMANHLFDNNVLPKPSHSTPANLMKRALLPIASFFKPLKKF